MIEKPEQVLVGLLVVVVGQDSFADADLDLVVAQQSDIVVAVAVDVMIVIVAAPGE